MQPVDELLVVACAERRDDRCLRFAAREERGAVDAGQEADLRRDGADGLGVAAVDAVAGVEDAVADDIRLDFLAHGFDELLRDGRFSVVFRQQGLDGLFACFGKLVDAVLLDFLAISGLEVFRDEVAELLFEGFFVVGSLGQDPGLFRAGFSQLDDEVDNGLEAFPAEHDGLEHLFLGQFVRFGFNHQHAFLGTGDDEVELAVLHFLDRRVQDELVVDVTDACGGDGAHEGDA